MAEMHYLDLDLLVTRSGRRYRAHVVGSPAGQADTEFRRPFSDLEIENFVLKVGGRRSGTRRIESPEMEAARQFGQRLFGSAFGGEIGGCFQRSLDEAERQGAGLRVRLHLTDVPELADLPWEYLYNPAISSFLALSVDTPLVRYTDRLGRITPLAVQPPLKVLAMISSPRDYPSLDVEGEWEKLSTTLGALQQRGLVALERVEPTLGALQQRLLGGQYHIFHFVGHGGFDPQGEEGVLILEDESGRGRKVTAHQLGVV
ncbi:MAG: CHAT domain-containing protein, partial [Chloroflexota bacterium]|nr:CHAT domain-containing protein [Chloroflexota bacterium]